MKSLLHQYQEVRRRTHLLCEPLAVEDYVPQPALFASPVKWHIAHTTWFFEEMILKNYLTDYQEFNPDFNFLFNSYYNTIGKRTERQDRGLITRPGVAEVYAYRAFVDEKMAELLSAETLETALVEVVTIGLHHEHQHQELLLTDLKYGLSLNPLFPVYKPGGSLCSEVNSGAPSWLTLPEGIYETGFQGNGFCFDNELGRHKTYLPGSKISTHLVTNAEYLEFIAAGAYTDFRHWVDEGWAWVNSEQIAHPLYWQKNADGGWMQFTLGGLQRLDPEAILCHISWFEAAAFASWKGMRLPTEAEWEAAAPQLVWGARWEWTGSAYLPYPGFRIAPGALGEYNGKFMINQMVLRGGSPATAPGHSRVSYRNFFHPHYQWQFSGIRLAMDL